MIRELITQKLYYFIVFIIFTLAFILRFYSLGTVPGGLNQDESAIGYNAYSILTTGKDEHGEVLPLYFKSFNDYKLPVYIYTTALSIDLFGLSEFSVRLPSAFFGFLTVIGLYFLVRIITKRRDVSLLAALILSINPWHLFFSRTAFEVNMAIAFLTFGVLAFYYSIEYKKNICFLISLLFFVLSLYTYNVTRLLSPLLLIGLIVLNRKYIQSYTSLPLKIIMLFLVGVSLIPFLLTFSSGSGFSSQQSVFIFGGESLAEDIEFRSYMTSLPSHVSALLFNKYFLIVWQYIKNLIAFFSPSYFYLHGGMNGDVGVGNYGMFHVWEFPFLIIGIIVTIKRKIKWVYVFFMWMILTVLLVSLSRDVPPPTRSYALIIPMVVLTSYGLVTFIYFLKSVKNEIFKWSAFTMLIVLMVYGFIFYQASYYLRHSIVYSKKWRTEDKKTAVFLKEIDERYDTIVIDDSVDLIYTSLLFYQEYPAKKFINNHTRNHAILFTTVNAFGKYQYRKIDWEKDSIRPRTLFITSPQNHPDSLQPLKVFLYPTRHVVLFYDKQIAQYPKNDIAFELYEGKSVELIK